MNEEEAKAADKKSARNTFIIVIVAIIIAVAAIGYVCLKLKSDSDHQKEYLDGFLQTMQYEADASVKAYFAHENYTSNIIAISLFRNITSTYSFLVPQSKILFANVDTLVNNVTMPNYYTALKQYFLCDLINKAYVQNSTRYFNFMEGEFIGMSYLHFNDVAYQDDYPPESNARMMNDGLWVRYYSASLEDAYAKLVFINGILGTIYSGGNQ